MYKYNWKNWTDNSDHKYNLIRYSKNRNFDELKDHNLVLNCRLELETLLKIASAKWGAINHNQALDICCGAGFITSCLTEFGFDSIGIDINQDAIQIARELHSNCRFYCGDATNPQSLNFDTYFDLILVREAHPFSRLDDVEFQTRVIKNYLALLNPGGIIIIAHARRGGGMYFPSVNFKKIKEKIKSGNCDFMGPYFVSIAKRFPAKAQNIMICSILSLITAVICRLYNARLIEAFYIHKSTKI